MEQGPTHVPGARFVDPAVLARIGNLELVARSVVDGVINGMHRSPYFGASVDFAEHRGYVPGDDIRRVDWKVFARTDRVLRQGVRGRLERQLQRAARRVEVDGVRRAAQQARLRQDAGRVSDLSRAQAARSRRPRHLRRGHRRPRAAVGQAPRRRAAHARSRQGERPGRLGPPLRKLAEHFGRRGIVV